MSAQLHTRALALVLALASSGPHDGERLEELRGVLMRRAASEQRTPAELAVRLAALGPEAIPVLYEQVTGTGLEALIGGEWQPSAWHCRPEEIPGLCAAALERAPAAAVREHIARVLDGEPTFQERLVVLRILGAQGSAAGLALVLRDAAALGELELGRPSVRTTLRAALRAILTGDPAAWVLLEKRIDELEPATCEVLVEAIGESGLARGMDVLARLLTRGRVATGHVAEAMAELEHARPWDLSGRTLAHCSDWLTSRDPRECARAARLAGRLHALEAVPALIELASHADGVVRRCATGALREIAGLPLELDPAGWAAWFEREHDWKDRRWEPLLGTLVAADPGAANEAMRELARHPLYRHESARVLAESLGRLARGVALAACAELERLGSRWALPGLVTGLQLRQPHVRAAAWRALCTLTGEKHELASEPWRALIGP